MEKWREIRHRFKELFQTLGTKFLIVVILVEHLLQGFIFGGGGSGIVGAPIIYLMKSYKLSASRIQVLRTVAVSPWALKPLFGMVSDVLYIGGYNKIPYIIATLIISIFSCFVIAFVQPLTPLTLTTLLFFVFLQIAVVDLLIEAKYTEKVALNPSISPDLITFTSVGGHLGQILAIVLVGLLVTYLQELHYIYLIPLPILFLTLWPIYWNWIEDSEYSPEQKKPLKNLLYRFAWYRNRSLGNPHLRSEYIPVVGLDLEKAKENGKIFLLGLIITGISLVSSLIGFLNVPTLWLFVFSLVSSIVMMTSFYLMIDRRIALIQIFVILQNMFTISIDSAAFFFYTDQPTQYPEGPHFSNFFFVTVMGVIAIVFSIASHVFYNLFMTKWKFRNVLLMANLVYIIVSIPSTFFYLRWNLKAHIPDSLFVLGSEALSVVTGTWTMMPLVLLMLQLCPEGIEATVFALLAGSSNLGNALSQYQGAFILEMFHVNPSGALGESHQFDNLWKVSLISLCLPLIPICTIPFLIPDASQTERLLVTTEEEALQKEMEEEEEMQKVDKFLECESSDTEFYDVTLGTSL